MSTAEITITDDFGKECALLLFALAPKTWEKTVKDRVIRFLKKQIPPGTEK